MVIGYAVSLKPRDRCSKKKKMFCVVRWWRQQIHTNFFEISTKGEIWNKAEGNLEASNERDVAGSQAEAK